MLAIDTECDGIDFFHSTKPYFLTMCKDNGEQTFYCWDVDPLTRKPIIPKEDIREIQRLLRVIGGWSKFPEEIAERHKIVMQNSKYDVLALESIGITDFPWHMCNDTLVASHILASNQPHDLTSLALLYLSIDIQPYEDELKSACMEARRWVRKEYPDWRLAKEGLPEMPSVKSSSKEKQQRGGESEKSWKADAWVPRALVKKWWEESEAFETWSLRKSWGTIKDTAKPLEKYTGWEFRPPEIENRDHPWWTVLSNYANADSAATIALWPVLRDKLKERGLWNIYQWKNRLMQLACRMEKNGITVNLTELDRLEKEFKAKSAECREKCLKIAWDFGYGLELPKKGLNNSLRNFCFNADGLNLPVVKETEKGNASLDKYAIEMYQLTLEPNSPQLDFITSLIDGRKVDTGLGFIESYRKFGVPCGIEGFIKLHPQINPCGTDSTRFSSSNPNSQQCSKQEKINLRKAFGPAPGREWYSADAKNIELRIPAYKAGEEAMIALFERPKDPPFYGSQHLLNFSVIYPDIWEKEIAEVGIEKVGPHVKSKYDGSWYTYAKNTGLGIQYRAGRATADKAAHRPGSYDKIIGSYPNLHGAGGLNGRLVNEARRNGYVNTFPDNSIDPNKGYPLMVSRNEYGKVLDTTPLNYAVQGTAGVWMGQALLKCQDQLDDWHKEDGFDGFISLTVHDEIVFDFPISPEPDGNLWRVEVLRKLMEECGDNIGVPTPVSVERHVNNWAEGVEV